VFETQYGEHERRERGLAGTAEVPGCAWLSVGHDRQQPPLAEGVHAIPERVAYLRPTVPFPRPGGDSQSYVVPEQGDQRLRVGLFMRGDVALEEEALLGIGFGDRSPVQPAVRPLITKGGAGALERAVDRRDARVHQFGDVGGGPADQVAQDQHSPLARWQELDRREEGQ
jgi:hypothetical protein